MKVLVTGAAGHLGGHLVAALAPHYDVTGLDRLAPPNPLVVPCLQADLSSGEGIAAVLDAADSPDIVVHCAAIHPWKPYTDDQYLDANVKGTWHLYAALAAAGIKKVVLTSSIAANGYNAPWSDWPVPEANVYPVGDIYSQTKRFQEDIALFYARNHGVRTFALRPPAFFPLPATETGVALLGPFAVVSDIVGAHVAAVHKMAGPEAELASLQLFEAFFVTNSLPYTTEDFAEYASTGELGPLVQRHFPQAFAWFQSQGQRGLGVVYSLDKAARLLHWQPQFNFPQWWDLHSQQVQEISA